jgi:hypothetical protein
VLDSIYANSDSLMAALLPCRNQGVAERLRGYPCPRPGSKRFAEELRLPWAEQAGRQAQTLFDFIVSAMAIERSSYPNLALSNQFVVRMLCHIAREQPDSSQLHKRAMEQLLTNTFYPALRLATPAIMRLVAEKGETRPEVRELEAYADLSSDKKLALLAADSVLQRRLSGARLPLYTRARLGDTLAEDTLLARYRRARQYSDKANLAQELGRAGTPRALTELVRSFNAPFFGVVARSCTTESIRRPILLALMPHHPNDPLLNDSLEVLIWDSKKHNDSAYLRRYYSQFADWAQRMYHTVPESTGASILFMRQCVFIN